MSARDSTREGAGAPQKRRLPPAQRREQILAAATRAFAQDGYAATGLEDVARQAGVTRAIVYRHFASKADLYVTVLDRVLHRLVQATAAPDFTHSSIDGLLTAATEDPDGFRLLFRHAAREPEFREHTEQLRRHVFAVTHAHLAALIPDPRWAAWASTLVPAAVIEAVIAWLDAGQPDETAIGPRVARVVSAIVDAAREREPSDDA